MAEDAERLGLPLIELRKVVPFVAVTEAVNGLLVTSPCAARSSLTGCQKPGEQPGQPAGDPDDLLEVLERETAADVELMRWPATSGGGSTGGCGRWRTECGPRRQPR